MNRQIAMDIYQHDSPDRFRIVLKGDLGETGTQQLRWAWQTAKSTLNGKQVIVEVSDVGSVDPAGLDLLSRMREAGGARQCGATTKLRRPHPVS